ncbi:putative membrane protein [Enterobacter hormaechei subsp. hoffmannii]|nr:putative membrane protein [Enterobacter hormaechei subsp. hoffmannii]
MFISAENDWAQPVPLTAIASLMPALSPLMLLPAFVDVFGTIS